MTLLCVRGTITEDSGFWETGTVSDTHLGGTRFLCLAPSDPSVTSIV